MKLKNFFIILRITVKNSKQELIGTLLILGICSIGVLIAEIVKFYSKGS